MANQLLLEAIPASFEANHGIYGSTRVYREIRGMAAWGEKNIARLMKEDGQRAKLTRTDFFFTIKAFYNRRRLHSSLGCPGPETFEAVYYRQ